MENTIFDLRSAIEFLKDVPGQLIETDRRVNPVAEIAGIYRHVGARGTVKRPTGIGPMMLFNNVEGYPDFRVAIGILSNRARVGRLLCTPPEKLGQFYVDCLDKPVEPVVVPRENAPCREEVRLAADPDFDLRKLIPGLVNTELDAGPYITMGLCYARDPDTRKGNATIHRMCIQGRDEMTIGFGGYRHIGVFKDKALARGETLPVSVSIGVDPAIYLASCFEPPTTPLGFDELSIAGAMRNKAVELTRCLTIDEYCVANAEIVIEGEIIDRQVWEDQHSHTGRAMPEFAGYIGVAKKLPVLKVRAVTFRRNPIMQICIGSSEEHVNMAGIPAEAAILGFLDRAMPGKALNVYCPPSGGGKLSAVIQFRKTEATDEGRQRQAALGALAACPELKNVFLVDEDVDLFDPHDVLWAMTTRFRPDKDLIVISGVRCHGGDPSQQPFYDATMSAPGLAHKSIYDCTVPFRAKEEFLRPDFMEVDVSEFFPGGGI
ncbi:MAG: UbiD family decarboxylase [Clostridiales Family XIII bacterium]|jgi:4-hydroxy-3-polyprenylbenzoate decarboxylase|nr:UbiD family decarboxylase [Clostridiales Family XIII bacterium]